MWESSLPLAPYTVHSISGERLENLLGFVSILWEVPIQVGVLLEGYDFEGYRELIGMRVGGRAG